MCFFAENENLLDCVQCSGGMEQSEANRGRHGFCHKNFKFELCCVASVGRMVDMLTIAADTLPQTALSYTAFRVAFFDTLERMSLALQVNEDPFDGFGYLTEVPFLRGVPTHIQLDVLADTWAKHNSKSEVEADLVDESVVYAVCETTARIVEQDPATASRFLAEGPRQIDIPVDRLMGIELRNLHLRLSNEGDFLLISQFADMTPDDADEIKVEFGLNRMRLEDMFEPLGRWYMSVDFIENLHGLCHPREIARAISVIGLKQQPLA